ncbi:hypothetical protein [Kitasatospora aureofaciens]|uniref:hypothetical protein n=1 Tax=Kitasatospora aureofaciens TaxID=1894 RepID=UPI001C460838|nr:hypothetical protein [Kitasatospora aureofaciens]MBV6701975.1 hypothetical protein [Kitasatospora aureofaciens]
MSRTTARFLAGGVAVVLAVTGLSGAAAADTTATAPTGSAVVVESNAFLQSAATNGVVIVPLPNAGVSYDTTTGLSTTLPVTGGSVNLRGYYGNVTLDGSLLFVDVLTGRSVCFKQLAFSADKWRLTGVPDGSTTPVSLLKPAGIERSAQSGTTQTLTATGFTVDPTGAQFLDTQLSTTFFTGGQSVGSFSLTFNG